MISGKYILGILVLCFSLSSLAEVKKARVITETGKKWNVFFLKMSHDTVYLKVYKPNGTPFHISGHKSKFRKVEFADGSLLDLSLSDFILSEKSQKNSSDISSPPPSRDTVVLNGQSASPAKSDTTRSDNQFTTPDIGAMTGSWDLPADKKNDTMGSSMARLDSLAAERLREKKMERPLIDSGGLLTITTEPSKAAIEIDGRTIEGITPLIVNNVGKGEHRISARKDSLYASTNISLENGEVKQVALSLEKLQGNKPVAVIKKKRGWGIVLCVLSATAIAGGGALYYLYGKDHDKEMQYYQALDQASVKGDAAGDLIAKNKEKHESAQLKLLGSEILFGMGAACLTAGLIIVF
jgi:hypothetical protein